MLSNAVKYTSKGKVLLGCRRQGTSLCIEVWDTGPGIKAQELPHIFDDFYRVDATARGQQGVGLGLAVVQRMAKSLGHPLAVKSEPGRGTVFRLTVPMVGRKALTMLAQQQAIPAETATVSPFAKISVCCIDDDLSNVTALRALLEQWQVGQIHTCLDVADTLALAATQSPPDVLIIDYQLGQHQNGLALHQQLQQYWPQVPAILVSAAPEPDLPSRAKQQGLIFLAKPIKAAALRATFNHLKLGNKAQ